MLNKGLPIHAFSGIMGFYAQETKKTFIYYIGLYCAGGLLPAEVGMGGAAVVH